MGRIEYNGDLGGGFKVCLVRLCFLVYKMCVDFLRGFFQLKQLAVVVFTLFRQKYPIFSSFFESSLDWLKFL